MKVSQVMCMGKTSPWTSKDFKSFYESLEREESYPDQLQVIQKKACSSGIKYLTAMNEDPLRETTDITGIILATQVC